MKNFKSILLGTGVAIALFSACETKKEAVLKLRGTGIVDDLHHVLNGEGYSLETHIVFEKQYAWSVAYAK